MNTSSKINTGVNYFNAIRKSRSLKAAAAIFGAAILSFIALVLLYAALWIGYYLGFQM